MNTERSLKLRGRYYLVSVILSMKSKKYTNEQIAEILDCNISSVKYAIRHSAELGRVSHDDKLDPTFGEELPEYLRVAAVHKCLEFLTLRGWQVGETDAKCAYDVFAVKGSETIKIQVRSTSNIGGRGWPSFKTSRLYFNTKKIEKRQFVKGDFDYWFFYSCKKDAWMIPFDEVKARSVISMEGYDSYYVG